MAWPAARERGLWILWLAVVGALAVLLAVLHVSTTFPYIPLEGLAAFTGPEPFQRRVLIPALAAWLGRLGLIEPVLLRFLLLEAVGWVGLIAAAWWVLGMLRASFTPTERRWLSVTVVLPVGVQLMLPARFRLHAGDVPVGDLTAIGEPFTRLTAVPGLYYPYDLPAAVFLLTLVGALWRLVDSPSRRAAALYGLLLALATLNRETTLLIVPLAVWTLRHHLPPGKLALLTVAHFVVIVGITAWLGALLQPVPNPRSEHVGGFEWYLWTNMRTLSQPIYAVSALLPLAAGAWLPPLVWWRDVSSRLRAVIVLYGLPTFAAALAFGIVLETRVFTELAAALWLVAMGALLERRGRTAPPAS